MRRQRWVLAVLGVLLLAGGCWLAETLRSDRLTGHTAAITGLAITPIGHTLISASRDDTVRVWDLDARRLLRTIPTGSEGVEGMALTPDGTLAVTAGHDGSLALWRVADGTLARRIAPNEGLLRAVAVAPDGTWVAAASASGTITLWRMADGEPIRTIITDLGDIPHLAIAPDGKTLAANGDGDAVGVWEVADGSLLRRWQEEHDTSPAVGDIAYTPDNQYVIESRILRGARIRFVNGVFERFRLADGLDTYIGDWGGVNMLEKLFGKRDTVQRLLLDPTGSLLIVGQSKQVLIWPSRGPGQGDTTATPVKVGELDAEVTSLALAPVGTLLAAGTADGSIRLWNVSPPSFPPGPTLPPFAPVVRGPVAFSADGRSIVTGDQVTQIWRVADNWLLGHLDRLADSSALTPDGALVALSHREGWADRSGSVTTTLEVWRLSDMTQLRSIPIYSGQNSPAVQPAISADGQQVAAGIGRSPGVLNIWKIADGQLRQTIPFPPQTYAPDRIAFSPDGTLLAGLWKRSAVVWRLSDSQELATITGDSATGTYYRDFAWSPDSQELALTNGPASHIQIWDRGTATVMLPLQGEDLIDTLAYSPDGTRLAGTTGRTAYLWQRTATGWQSTPTQSVSIPGAAAALAFDPGGHYLAAAGNPIWIRSLVVPSTTPTP